MRLGKHGCAVLGHGWMPALGISLAIAVAASMGSAGEAKAPASAGSASSMTAIPEPGPALADLRSAVSLARDSFARGEAVPFTYRVTNESSRPVTIWNAGFWGNHRLLLERADGHPAHPTEEGRQAAEAFLSGAIRKNVPVTIPPGESWVAGPFDLTRYFQLSEPGWYRLRVHYQHVALSLTSSEVTFLLR